MLHFPGLANWADYREAIYSLILLVTAFLTYIGSIKGAWLIDDMEGIQGFDGRAYDPKQGLTWWRILTFLRWKFALVPNPGYRIAVNHKGEKDPRQYAPSPIVSHRLSLMVFCATAPLAYFALIPWLGSNLSFLATLLWTVHPLGCMVVAWISGVGYLLSGFFLFIALNWLNLTVHGSLLSVAGFMLLIALSFRCQFTSIGIIPILFFMAEPIYAMAAIPCAAFELFLTYKGAVGPRLTAFRSQNLHASTYFNWRKLIVAAKTFGYYVRLILWPKRLGLYHKYGYHYKLPDIEWEDAHFWFGLACLAAIIATIILAPMPFNLAALWLICFLFFVLNWVTIFQFVVDRYGWLPSMAACIIAAYLLAPYPAIYGLIFGLLLMRTWTHLPTFDTEIKFYQSNMWNFPDSEVALCNLGMAYIRQGQMGSAIDAWQMSTKMNPNYDVGWYNLFSFFYGQGAVKESMGYLKSAVNCEPCHFKTAWTDQLRCLEEEIRFEEMAENIPPQDRLQWKKMQLDRLIADPATPWLDLWKKKLKITEEELARSKPQPPVAATPPPPPAAAIVVEAETSGPIIVLPAAEKSS